MLRFLDPFLEFPPTLRLWRHQRTIKFALIKGKCYYRELDISEMLERESGLRSGYRGNFEIDATGKARSG